MTIRTGHPDFLDLPWNRPLAEWDTARLAEMPRPVRRPEQPAQPAQSCGRLRATRHVAYGDAVYAITELPAQRAQHEYAVLCALEERGVPVALPVGLVEGRQLAPAGASESEAASDAALITRQAPFTFSYRALVSGRAQLVDALAGLLVELHLAGCFWGQCSLDSVLLRRDGDGVVAILGNAEGTLLCDRLDDDVRAVDLAILGENLTAAMVELATAQGIPLASADLWLGADVAARYHALWRELCGVAIIGVDEQHRIAERVERVHALGFDIRSLAIEPAGEGSALALEIEPGRRHFHASQLARLTGMEVTERQARQLLTDLAYYSARRTPAADESLTALEWRAFVLEPMLARLRAVPGVTDPVQAYCDLLVHRYLRSKELGRDMGTEAAFEDWLQRPWPCALAG